jgi:glycosyltransferase involved in cell wall biosynthesis
MYDALNKGIELASGDIIGILHSDDSFYNENVISKIVLAFENSNIDSVFGDIVFISNKIQNKIVRIYSANKWRPFMFAFGMMPPHPSFFCKSEVFKKYGVYKIDYKIASDFEILIRFFLVLKIRYKYLPMITTKMRLGGKSTKNINSNFILNREIKRACEENGIYTNYFMIYSKYLFKIKEFFFSKGYSK